MPAGQVLVRKDRPDLSGDPARLLRQDPDVILLGEIRDFRTAEVAFRRPHRPPRLLDPAPIRPSPPSPGCSTWDSKPYVVATALEGIIAQRLVRRLCPDCREIPVDTALAARPGPQLRRTGKTCRGRGCPNCQGGGYRSRVGVES